jgi:hypothetical protein
MDAKLNLLMMNKYILHQLMLVGQLFINSILKQTLSQKYFNFHRRMANILMVIGHNLMKIHFILLQKREVYFQEEH